MIVHEVSQNTDAWRSLRAGKATASRMDDVVTLTGELRKSQGVQTYINELVAETLLGAPILQASNPWTNRGHDQEGEGASWYAWERDVPVTTCGFITTDDLRFGASPDRLVGDDGVLEIKAPSAVEHVSNMRAMTTKYNAQVQSQLYVTGRDWADLLSYNPTLPPVVHRIPRDEQFIYNLHEALYAPGGFFEQFDEALKVCRSYESVVTLECRAWKPDRTLCGSRDGVQTIDGVPMCSACAASMAELFGITS